MRIVVWVCEGTWPACIDAVAGLAGSAEAEIVLLHVRGEPLPPPRPGSLIGLGRIGRVEQETRQLSRQAAEQLLSRAQSRPARGAETRLESGPAERVVTVAAAEADYLVVGRDGDVSRLGPRSLGRETRFVIDHAPCPVLLVWPGAVPGPESIPPAPRHP